MLPQGKQKTPSQAFLLEDFFRSDEKSVLLLIKFF